MKLEALTQQLLVQRVDELSVKFGAPKSIFSSMTYQLATFLHPPRFDGTSDASADSASTSGTTSAAAPGATWKRSRFPFVRGKMLFGASL
jgi:hypothetical protein